MHDSRRSTSLKEADVLSGNAGQPMREEHAKATSGHEIHGGLNFQNAGRPKFGWVIVAFAVIVGGFAGLFMMGYVPMEKRLTMLNAEASEVKNAAPRVVVISAKPSPPASDLLLPGTIQAVRDTTIYARTSGYLKHWFADIGDSVKAGQLLAEIDTPEIDMQLEHSKAVVEQTEAARQQAEAAFKQAKAILEQARATLEQSKAQVISAQASLENAKLTMTRFEQLRGTSAVSEQDISDKETAVKTADATLQAAKATVGANEAAVGASEASVGAAGAAINAAKANVGVAQADVRQLEVMKSFEKVTAPFDGIITSRQTEEGSLVAAGSASGAQPLFRLAATKVVRVFVDVPQTRVASIKPGQQAEVLVREFPGAKFTGTVARTANAIDTASRTLRTEIHVPNPTGELLDGMYAQAKFSIVLKTPPMMLPSSALVVNAEGTQVAVVKDGKVHFQKVVIESDFGANFGVSSGVDAADQVIANPSERLNEGMAVSIAPSATPAAK